MKVAIISEWLDAWRGGAETSTSQFLHYLMDAGLELHVFTRSRPSPTPGLHVHSISGASMSRTRRSVTFAHRVERRIRENTFDVVHAITPCRYVDIYQPRGGTVAESIERNIALRNNRLAQSIKRATNKFNLKQRYLLALEKTLFNQKNGPIVVAISDYVVRQLKNHYRLPDDRIRKIYNGTNSQSVDDLKRQQHRQIIRNQYNIKENDFLAIVVAHNFKLKGVHRWMEALARLQQKGRKNIRSLVIGKGDTEPWHRLLQKLGLNNILTLTGPTERIQEFYHAADILVHPTYYDPCSRVVLEAMTAGLPCITTRWDGASEMIEHGRNGYILNDPGDAKELVDFVERLMDVDHCLSLSRSAIDVKNRMSMERHAKEMLNLYEEIRSHRRMARAV